MKLITFIISIVLITASTSTLSAWSPVEPNQEITAGVAMDPQTMDPGQTWEDTSILFTYNIFDTLVQVDPGSNKPAPSLAVSWKVSEGGKTWVFKLREGVSFSDGTPFNADAVVFSFTRQMDKNFPYHFYDYPLFKEIFPYLQRVEKKDDLTVAFYLSEPFYPFLSSLTAINGAVVSPTAFKKYGKQFQDHPVGTGPFQLKNWEKGKRITLEANPLYWGPKPNFKQFTASVESNVDITHRLFHQQKLDIIFTFSMSKTTGLRLVNWVKVYQGFQPAVSFIALNFKHPDLQKKNVRKALDLLWNSNYLKYVYQEYSKPTDSFIPRGMPGYLPALETHRFSLHDAINALQAEKLDHKLSFTYLVDRNAGLEIQILDFYTGNLKKAGIDLKIQPVELEEMYRRIGAGDFDMVSSSWIADYPDTHSLLFPMFSEALQAEGMANMASYPERDLLRNLIHKAASEANEATRAAIYKNINRMIKEEVLCIPTYYVTTDFLYNTSRIRKVSVNPTGVFCLRGLKLR